MKFVITADIHIGSSVNYGFIDQKTGLNTRIVDFLNSLDFAVDYTLQNDIDVFVVAGDIYKTRNPRQILQKEFSCRIKRLIENDKHVVLLQGNHDIIISDNVHTSSVIQVFAPERLYVIDKPTCIKFSDTFLCSIPYISKDVLSVSSHDDVLAKYKEYICQIKDTLNEQKNKKIKKIFVGHQIVEGSLYVPNQDIAYLKDTIIPCSYFSDFDISFFGHIHNYQVLSKEPRVVVVGSLDRIDFNDAGVTKGFIVYDSSTDQYEFIKNNSREMILIKIVADNEDDMLNKIKKKLKGSSISQSIVRIEINVPNLSENSINKVRDLLSKSAWFAAGVDIKTEQKVRTRNDKINEKLSPKDALLEYLEIVIKDSDYRKKVYDFGAKIIDYVELNEEK